VDHGVKSLPNYIYFYLQCSAVIFLRRICGWLLTEL